MSLKTRIFEDIKTAMRGREAARLSVLRMLSAAIKQREVDERVELDDADVLAIVEKLIKQRRDAASQFREGGREELAEQETAEAELLEGYLPPRMDEAELTALIDELIAATGAAGPRDMGKVMAQLKPRIQGRADMGQASQLVKQRLTG